MTITFSPPDLTLDTIYDWDTALNWSSRTIPNSATAVAVFPLVTDLQSGDRVFYEVEIQSGESYEVSAVTLDGGELGNSGTLTVLHEVTIGASASLFTGGSSGILTAGSLENDGDINASIQLTVTGDLVNRGQFEGGLLTLSAGRFENIGSLVGGTGDLAVSIGSGGFANLSGGTLTGGTYDIGSDESISFEINGPITSLAATVYLGGAYGNAAAGVLETYAATGTAYVSLLSSLTTIAPSGLLALRYGSFTLGQAVTDQGAIILDDTLNGSSLTVSSTGTLVSVSNATLSLTGTLVDNGSIVASVNPLSLLTATLVVGAPVTGSGSIVIGTGGTASTGTSSLAATVELTAADSVKVVFADRAGTLQLDAPQSFTGAIEGFTQGDEIVLSGISLQSVTSASYSGHSTHGVLTLQEVGGGSLTLDFQGSYTTADFSLAAGTQTTSASPASIVITDSAVSSTASITAEAAIGAYQTGTLVAGTIVLDSAANIAGALDGLQTLAAAGDIGQIVLSDPGSVTGVSSVSLTAAQIVSDSAALGEIAGAYMIDVTGATVAQAISLAGGSHIASIAVTDSIADISAQIDKLGTLASTGQISSIAITDTDFAPISVTSTQFANDHTAFEDMTGDFTVTVTVTASAGSQTIEGLTGHSVTVVFSGAASAYSLTAQGDGIGLTVSGAGITDDLRNVTALQFSDLTDIVAQTPGSNGVVTTGNVAELYGAVFGRTPDVAGLAFYQGVLTANPGTSLTTLAQYFLASPEYTGNSTHDYPEGTDGDTAFITDSYQNLLHRAPETGAVPYYLAVIDSFTNGLTEGTAAYAAAEALGHAYVLTYFSQSPEFLTDVQVTATNPSSAQHWLVLV